MTVACRRLKVKVKVKVMGQANAVGPTSIEGSFFLVVSAKTVIKFHHRAPHVAG